MSRPPSPSGSARVWPEPRIGLAVLIAGLAVLRLVSAGAVPLTEDEAYYRLWSQHLALGYYDHPPMIAWWIRAGTVLAGDTPLGVRLLPCLANLVATALVFDIGRLAGGGRTGLTAALFYNCTLTVGAAAALAVPDVPAGLFWTLALWALVRSLHGTDARWWALAGAAAGLACLSKYSALFLAPAVLLWLGASAEGRKRLAQPWPWIAAALAVALFAANVAWNAQHHWETFDKQFGRAAASQLAPHYLIEFLAGQFLLFNPALAILAGLGAANAWRQRTERPIPWLMLASLIPFLAYLLAHSLHDRVQAHWPVPLYSAGAVLAALAARDAGGWRKALVQCAPLGLALSVLALAHAALPATDGGGADPALQLRGWPGLARTVDAARLKAGAAWVGTLSYGTAAQLQAADLAGVLQVNERARYEGFGAPDRADLSQPGLIVDLPRRIDPAKLAVCFAKVEPLPGVMRADGRAKDERYGVVRVSGSKVDLIKNGCPG
jgi:4-amino-4-deoxy-L-arabinose transferase-like glycosyltransferase